MSIMKWANLIRLEKNVMKVFDLPPATHRYRLTPEEIERKRWRIKIQDEKNERHRRQLIEEGKIRPDERDEKPA